MTASHLNSRNFYHHKLFCTAILFLTTILSTPVFAQFAIEGGYEFGIPAKPVFGGETRIASSPEIAVSMELPIPNMSRTAFFMRFGWSQYKIIWADKLGFPSNAFPLHFGVSYYPMNARNTWGPFGTLALGTTIINGDVYETPFSVLARVGLMFPLGSLTGLTYSTHPTLHLSIGCRYDVMKSESGSTVIPQVMLGLQWRLLK